MVIAVGNWSLVRSRGGDDCGCAAVAAVLHDLRGPIAGRGARSKSAPGLGDLGLGAFGLGALGLGGRP